MNVTVEEINKAYSRLEKAQVNFNVAAKEHVLAKVTLDEVEAAAIREGVEGKNAEIRKANLALIVENEALAVLKAEDAVNFAREELALAENEVSRIKLIVRYDDISSRTHGAG